ncbi:MAG: hypothetical protein ACRDPY_33820 [Streptosporangiaceae bacterium]
MLEGDALGQQLRYILDAEAADTAQQEERIGMLERQGCRIVAGGQTGSYGDDEACDFACTDWRTGEILFTGRGTYQDYLAAFEAAADRDGREWCHRDRVDEVATEGTHDDLAQLDPARAPGMPASLVHALIEWVEGPATVQELADLTGLPAARVQDLLRHPGALRLRSQPSCPP